MEMRASEDIEIGQDLIPPLSPLSFSLNDSLLLSHCSACFSPLPSNPHNPPLLFPPTVLYCSSQCSNYDSVIHLSSAEPHLLRLLRSRRSSYSLPRDSSDLRLALRFLQSYASTSHSCTGRIAGLLTNREKLTASCSLQNSDGNEILARILDGARAIAMAKRMRDGLDFSDEISIEDVQLEEAALCLVLTNAVEVQDKSGRTLGVALYGQNFSWINHSCSPNACYRISLPSEIETSSFYTSLRIAPYCSSSEKETQVVTI